MKIIDSLQNEDNPEGKKKKSVKNTAQKITLPFSSNKSHKSDVLQLNLGLKESPINRLFEVRQKLDKFEDRIRVSHYWRNPMIWIMLFLPILMIFIAYKQFFSTIVQIPDQIALLWINPDFSTLFLSKYYLVIIPIIPIVSAIITAVVIRMSYRKLEKVIFLLLMINITITFLSYLTVFRVMHMYV